MTSLSLLGRDRRHTVHHHLHHHLHHVHALLHRSMVLGHVGPHALGIGHVARSTDGVLTAHAGHASHRAHAVLHSLHVVRHQSIALLGRLGVHHLLVHLLHGFHARRHRHRRGCTAFRMIAGAFVSSESR